MLLRPKTALGANLSVFGLQLGTQNPPKIHIFPLQDQSYLKMRQNPKLGDSSGDGPHFGYSRGSRNPPKIYEKSILRAFSLEVLF